MQSIDCISPQNVPNYRISKINIELASRDIQLKRIYQQEGNVAEKASCDFLQEEEGVSFKFRSFKVLKEPIVVSDANSQAFLDRLSKMKELGFEEIYCDCGQTLLFHAEKGGFCALDQLTCSISAVFLNKDTATVAKAYGIASVRRIMKGNMQNVEDGENFSYVDLPLISKKDEEDLPKVETVENLLGPLDREQVLQFEQTGYVFNLDCRWALFLIENSKQIRKEAEQDLINKKMGYLPSEVQEFYGYFLENNKDSQNLKRRK